MTHSPEGENIPRSPVVISVDPLDNTFSFSITTGADSPAAYQGHDILKGSGSIPKGPFPEMVEYAIEATRDAYIKFDARIRRLIKN